MVFFIIVMCYVVQVFSYSTVLKKYNQNTLSHRIDTHFFYYRYMKVWLFVITEKNDPKTTCFFCQEQGKKSYKHLSIRLLDAREFTRGRPCLGHQVCDHVMLQRLIRRPAILAHRVISSANRITA